MPFIPLAKEVLIRDSWKASLSSTVRTGQFSSFETQEEPQEIDYGLEETTVIQPNQAGQQPQALQPQSENPLQGFGEQPQAEPVPVSGITAQISQEDEEAGF